MRLIRVASVRTAIKAGLVTLLFSFIANAISQEASTPGPAFGIHVHELDKLDSASLTGVKSVRLWDSYTAWNNIQPQRYLLKLDKLSNATNSADRLGLSIILTLGSTPAWASARPSEPCAYGLGCAAEPKNIKDWRHYIDVVTKTYKGKIECYEPWNEVSFPKETTFSKPSIGGEAGHFFSGSIASMVEISKTVYEEVKRNDPSACVLSPSFHSSGDWIQKLDQYLTAGGGNYMDALSFHFYFGKDPEESLRAITSVRSTLERHGLKAIPIWNTEVGIPFSIKPKDFPGIAYGDLVYSLVLRTYLVNFSQNISRVYWYAWDDGLFGLSEGTPNGKDGGEAIAAAIKILGSTPHVACTNNGDVWQCNVRSLGKLFSVTWSTKLVAINNTSKISLPYGGVRWGPTMETLEAGSVEPIDSRPLLIWKAP